MSVPAPAFVSPKAPLRMPPSVSIPEATVTVGEAVSITAPVPRFRELLPKNVKLPAISCGLLLARVSPLPDVLSIEPPAIVKEPVAAPRAVVLFKFKTPAFSFTPPEKVFTPLKVSVPAPNAVREPVPVIALASVPLLPEAKPI